jgi:RHH-type rel operon transcriptional repressor/antitoxin RelB
MATSIELDPAIDARLDQLATSTGRSKEFFLNELIAYGMDEIEDIYLAYVEIEQLQRGESTTRSLDAVSADLGLDD